MPRKLAFVLALLAALAPAPAASASPSGVVVSEFRFRGPAGASDEFLELVNAGAHAVDVSGWRLQACAATTGAAATRATIPAATILGPNEHLLVANASGYTGAVAADLTYGTGIADGGGVRLVTAEGGHVDGVASAVAPASECREGTGLALPTTDSDTSFERVGGTQDTDDNGADFTSATSDPQNRASVLPSLSVSDVIAGEEGEAVFTVTLSTASVRPVTVEVTTGDGTATSPADYAASRGTVALPPGTVTATFAVPLVGDALDEPEETFVVELSAPTRATIADGVGQVTLVDDDAEPSLAIAAGTAEEGGEAVVTVSLSAPSAFAIGVDYATADGTATAAEDYAAAAATLTFAPGEVARTFSVATTDDALDEPDETFTVTLANAVNASIAAGAATATIVDDDAPAADDPASTPGRLLLAGRLGERGFLVALVSFSARSTRPRGVVAYFESGTGLTLVSSELETLVVAGTRATVKGKAIVRRHAQPFELRVEGRNVSLSWPDRTVAGTLRGLALVAGA